MRCPGCSARIWLATTLSGSSGVVGMSITSTGGGERGAGADRKRRSQPTAGLLEPRARAHERPTIRASRRRGLLDAPDQVFDRLAEAGGGSMVLQSGPEPDGEVGEVGLPACAGRTPRDVCGGQSAAGNVELAVEVRLQQQFHLGAFSDRH